MRALILPNKRSQNHRQTNKANNPSISPNTIEIGDIFVGTCELSFIKIYVIDKRRKKLYIHVKRKPAFNFDWKGSKIRDSEINGWNCLISGPCSYCGSCWCNRDKVKERLFRFQCGCNWDNYCEAHSKTVNKCMWIQHRKMTTQLSNGVIYLEDRNNSESIFKSIRQHYNKSKSIFKSIRESFISFANQLLCRQDRYTRKLFPDLEKVWKDYIKVELDKIRVSNYDDKNHRIDMIEFQQNLFENMVKSKRGRDVLIDGYIRIMIEALFLTSTYNLLKSIPKDINDTILVYFDDSALN